MDFTGRSSQPAQPTSNTAQFGSAPAGGSKKNKSNKNYKLTRVGGGILGLLVLALVVAVIGVISFSGKSAEAGYVDESKMQAVFLQTGQVYFGKINADSVKGNSFTLSDIYYLQTSNTGTSTEQTNANTNVSLVKLGCELHAPVDSMVINRDQVTFWENLQDSGQVAKAVATFKKDNPSGQKCQDQSTGAGAAGTTNVQGTGTGTSTGTGSTSTTNR